MQTKSFRGILISGAALAAVTTIPANAKNARQNYDMVGESVSIGEGKLESRGYTFITGSHGRSGIQHAYWWNGRAKSCLHVKSERGSISDVTDASRNDCHQKGSGSDVGAAIAVGVGAAIIGGLLSHKKHHHDDGKHYDNRDHEHGFERGYNDGLHGVAYHNYDRSDAYSSGYSAGVDQRQINTDYHHGRGGYSPTARFRDVIGLEGRAARRRLEERGFARVDRFGTDSTRYSIFWRAASRQCLQLAVVNGRAQSIQDVGNDPNCR